MAKFFKVVVALLGLSFLGLVASTGAMAGECARASECNRSTDGNTWNGTNKTPNKIKVVICHGFWDQLDVGSYKGLQTRWWEPVIVKGSWKSSPLPTITRECKTMWRKPGEQVAVYAECVKRVIWTEPIYRSGTYVMR